MAVTATPIFLQAPKRATANITATTTDMTGATTANIVDLLTAGANGAKILEISVTVPVTSALGYVGIWIDDLGAGTNRLFDTIPIAAITVSTTVAPYRISRFYENLVLKPTDKMKVGVTVLNNPTVVNALYGDY